MTAEALDRLIDKAMKGGWTDEDREEFRRAFAYRVVEGPFSKRNR